MVDAAVTQSVESNFPQLLDFLRRAGADDAVERHALYRLDLRNGTELAQVKTGEARLSGCDELLLIARLSEERMGEP